MTRFRKDQRVVSRIDAQGLQRGATYTVTNVHVYVTTFGDFVTYRVRGDDGQEHDVGNGHLVLTEAEPTSSLKRLQWLGVGR